MKRMFFIILLLGTFGARQLQAGTVGLSFKDTTILRGSTVYIPVRVDSNLTGLNVNSYELDITFTSDVFTIDSAVSTGTLTASWGAPTFNISSGKIRIAGVGRDTLMGTGILVYLRTTIPLGTTGSYGYLQFARALLNEGSPPTITRNGTINILNPPSLTISPDNALLTVGDSSQFSAYGGTAPYTWSTTDTSIATINGSGLSTGKHPGTCRIVAVDVNNISDTTSQIEVRAFKLMVRDTSYLQGQTFLLPIYITDLSLIDIYTGSLSISYDPNILTAQGTELTGTLLEPSGAPTVYMNPGIISIAFATTSHLNGVGTRILIFIRFKVTETNTYSSNLQFSSLVFNENVPSNYRNGYFSVTPRNTLTITPNTAILIAGDSLQFTASGGAVPPLRWTITDSSIATISSTGVLRAISSGILRVSVTDADGRTGISQNISIYDVRLTVRDTIAYIRDVIEFPINISQYSQGFYSAQMTVNFDTTFLSNPSLINTGTLTEGWQVTSCASPQKLAIAMVSLTPATGPGTLLIVRLIVRPTAPHLSYTQINLTNVLVNEGKPLPLIKNGQLHVLLDRVTFSISRKWNIISVPLAVEDSSKQALFPTAVSDAFVYVPHSGYSIRDKLHHGIGYWLKFQASEGLSIIGIPIYSETLTVQRGWNLIGSISEPVPVASISSNPPGIITGNFFGYVNGYIKSDTILPGKGYWVKVNQTGELILSAAQTEALAKSAIKIVSSDELPPPPPNEGTALEYEIPDEYWLEQAYPNPFNPTTNIKYQLPVDSKVSLKAHDLLGRVVSVLVDGMESAGYKSIEWNAFNVSSGMYFYRLEATSISDPSKSFTQVKKMLLMK